MTAPLQEGIRKNSGNVTIMAVEKKEGQSKEIVKFRLTPRLKCDSNSQCFFVVNKNKAGDNFQPVYKSEVKPMEQGEFKFNLVIIDSERLCNSDISNKIGVTLYKYDKSGSHKKIGQTFFTLGNMIDSGKNYTVDSVPEGQFCFSDFVQEQKYTFLDYVMGGCEIGVHVAIDFTQSNGRVDKPSSLHSLN